MQLSRRIQAVAASATIAVTARAKQMAADGIDVVSFGAGEPDFDTPEFIKAAARDKLARENALAVAPEQVLVTFGGKHALYDAFQCLLDPGDAAAIPAPYWVSYPEQVKLADGRCVVIPTRPETGFKITPDDVRRHAADAKILLLNSPCNPTGVTYTPDELAGLAAAVLETDLIVFADEIYEKLIYGRTRFVSFASLDPRLPARTLTFNGLAKTFAMTGWRLGWVAGPTDVIKAMARLMSHETTHPVSFAVAGALTAYTDPAAAETIEAMRAEFETRGRHMHQRLCAIDGVDCVEPTGAFYCFPDVSAHYGRTLGGTKVNSSLDFAAAALDHANVALVPGVAFGEDRCMRLSFATSLAQIDKGLDRLQEFLK